MKTIFLIISIVFLFASTTLAQQADQTVKQANDLYKKEQFQQAETIYNTAIEQDPANSAAKFNKVNAVYKQGKSEEAVKMLNDLTFKTEDNELKSRAYYNKGAILSAQKKLEESIDAYKDALRRNPNDNEARENLQKALTELKKKNPPPNPKENKKQQQQKQKKQQQQQPKMNQKEVEQRLKLLEQKEKEVQERLQKEKSKQSSGAGQKDW